MFQGEGCMYLHCIFNSKDVTFRFCQGQAVPAADSMHAERL
jgi:hypothetical protein